MVSVGGWDSGDEDAGTLRTGNGAPPARHCPAIHPSRVAAAAANLIEKPSQAATFNPYANMMAATSTTTSKPMGRGAGRGQVGTAPRSNPNLVPLGRPNMMPGTTEAVNVPQPHPKTLGAVMQSSQGSVFGPTAGIHPDRLKKLGIDVETLTPPAAVLNSAISSKGPEGWASFTSVAPASVVSKANSWESSCVPGKHSDPTILLPAPPSKSVPSVSEWAETPIAAVPLRPTASPYAPSYESGNVPSASGLSANAKFVSSSLEGISSNSLLVNQPGAFRASATVTSQASSDLRSLQQPLQLASQNLGQSPFVSAPSQSIRGPNAGIHPSRMVKLGLKPVQESAPPVPVAQSMAASRTSALNPNAPDLQFTAAQESAKSVPPVQQPRPVTTCTALAGGVHPWFQSAPVVQQQASRPAFALHPNRLELFGIKPDPIQPLPSIASPAVASSTAGPAITKPVWTDKPQQQECTQDCSLAPLSLLKQSYASDTVLMPLPLDLMTMLGINRRVQEYEKTMRKSAPIPASPSTTASALALGSGPASQSAIAPATAPAPKPALASTAPPVPKASPVLTAPSASTAKPASKPASIPCPVPMSIPSRVPSQSCLPPLILNLKPPSAPEGKDQKSSPSPSNKEVARVTNNEDNVLTIHPMFIDPSSVKVTFSTSNRSSRQVHADGMVVITPAPARASVVPMIEASAVSSGNSTPVVEPRLLPLAARPLAARPLQQVADDGGWSSDEEGQLTAEEISQHFHSLQRHAVIDPRHPPTPITLFGTSM